MYLFFYILSTWFIWSITYFINTKLLHYSTKQWILGGAAIVITTNLTNFIYDLYRSSLN